MKPTLFLHCGMYKTGSSFLQTMFSRNRKLLIKNGIHYPKSEKELDMYEGRITAGNGIHLLRTLSGPELKVVELLKADLADAEKTNLRAVLYSSELLYNSFAEKGVFDKFCSAVKKAGYKEIHALIYFRDPVSHALSTYKHRAKYGAHPEFGEWLENDYEIYDLNRAFLEYSQKTEIQWTCRKYHSDSTFMVRSSFVDWLGTSIPETPPDDRVNRSLQLNEIRVIQSLKKDKPGCEKFLRESFLKLATEEKESEEIIKDELIYLIIKKWTQYDQMLSRLNMKMNESEKLIIEPPAKTTNKIPHTTLSEKQLQAIVDGMLAYLKSKKLNYKIYDYWKRGIDKLRRRWAASKMNSAYPK